MKAASSVRRQEPARERRVCSRRAVARELVREQRRLQAVLQCWVNDLTAVVVHRAVLSDEVVEEFCRACGLPAWLSRELATGCD